MTLYNCIVSTVISTVSTFSLLRSAISIIRAYTRCYTPPPLDQAMVAIATHGAHDIVC